MPFVPRAPRAWAPLLAACGLAACGSDPVAPPPTTTVRITTTTTGADPDQGYVLNVSGGLQNYTTRHPIAAAGTLVLERTATDRELVYVIHLDDVAVDFPELNLVMAHAGRGFWYDRAFFLAKLGWLKPAFFQDRWRYALLFCTILAAVITIAARSRCSCRRRRSDRPAPPRLARGQPRRSGRWAPRPTRARGSCQPKSALADRTYRR